MINEARTAFDDPKQDLDSHIGDDKWLAKQWEGFNKKYFGGKLKKPKSIFWKGRGGTLGRCCWEFNGKNMYTSYIQISEKLKNYTTFKNTLVHEMVHQWVEETYCTKEAIRRANSCGMARCRKWWASINKSMGAGADGHHGTWLDKANQLMKKDSTLKITKYGDTDETKLSTREVNKTLKKQGKTHVVVQEGAEHTSRRHFYYCTDECYKRLVKRINDGEVTGQWTEYEFDPSKMVQEFKDGPMEYIGNSYYGGSFFDNLCERGIINKWKRNYLGGHKTEHHRRSRRSLFGSWF